MMLGRGPTFSLLPIDLSAAGTVTFSQMVSIVSFVRAEDVAGAPALSAKVMIQVGDVSSAAIPASVNTTIKLRPAANRVVITWDAQSGITAYVMIAADDGLLINSPPTTQLITQALGATVTMGAVAVGTTPVLIAAAGSRQNLTVKNNSASGNIYLGSSAAVTSATGWPMGAGEGFGLERTTAALWAVADAAGADLRYVLEA